MSAVSGVLARLLNLGRSCAAAAGLLALAATASAAQQYFEPLPTMPGVRVDVRALAAPDAARSLGIPVAVGALGDHGGRHVSGARAVLVVLGRFSDTAEPAVSAEQVRERMFTGTSTLADFYEDQSGGAFTVSGDVVDWHQSDVPLLDAAGTRDGHGWVGDSLRVHIARLLTQLDPVLDFGEFDNDGADGIPNSGDDDGRVDLLSVKYAEASGHCGGSGPWPHFGAVTVDGEPFTSDDPTPSGGRVQAPVYIIDSVVECDGLTPQGIAVTAHELGHAIGLPDYYRWSAGPEAEHRHWTVGCFDLMAAGGWGCGDGPLPTDGFGPTGLSAYSRSLLGWTQLEDVSAATDQSFVLEPLATSAHALRVWLAPESAESWIIEYRTRTGYDEPLPAEGVLVYHHDAFTGQRATDPALPPAYPYHLVEADGDDALRRAGTEGGNRGVATDVFATSGPSGPFGAATTPSTRDHLGGESTLEIHEITRSGGTATVRLSVGAGFRVASRQTPAAATVLEPVLGVIELTDGQTPYQVTEQLGALPEGVSLVLDGASLTVQGTPLAAGRFGLSVWIEDQAGRTVAQAIPLEVLDHPALDASILLRTLVQGGDVLGDPELSAYLDRSGNADGAFDLGDLRAYIQRQPS